MDNSPPASSSWEPHPWVAAGRDRLRFGLAIMGTRRDWPEYFAWATRAEALGFDSFWVQDHPMGGLDCWSALTALALRTTTIRLGTLVCCVSYRPPALLARLAADVDRLSGGRLVLGLGMGDREDEFAQMGLPWPPMRERQQALDEAAQIIRGAWGAEPFTFAGRHFRAEATRVQPPIQRPRVPVVIAGGGERVTLRQVAQHADMSNFGPHVYTGGAASLDDVRRKCAALRRHCEDLGRPFESVLRSHIALPLVLAPTSDRLTAKVEARLPTLNAITQAALVADTPQDLVGRYRELAETGMQYFIVVIHEDDHETLELMGGEVIPALTGAPPSAVS